MKRQTINPSKIARVEALKHIFSESKSVAVMDYNGLKVSQATQLRKDLKAAGGEMKVEKNTLFKIALKDLGSNIQDLKGLSAFVFSKTDEVAALKVVADFIKKNSVGSFKLGILGDRVLTSAEVEVLAKTPNLETSIAKLMFLFNYHTSKLVRALDAIAKKEVIN